MTKEYFVCHRERNYVTLAFAKDFYEHNKHTKVHKFKKDAQLEMKEGFYDDSNVVVVTIINGKYFKI